MGAPFIELPALAAELRARAAAGGRLVVAIAGPPGSGKSTTAELLAEALNTGAPGLAAVLPMDGYHYMTSIWCRRGCARARARQIRSMWRGCATC